jgi:hypothetical protein
MQKKQVLNKAKQAGEALELLSSLANSSVDLVFCDSV